MHQPAPNQRMAQNRWISQKDQTQQTINMGKKNCQFKDHPVVQCDMKHKANPEEEMKKLYPVHDFDAIILAGLVVVLQGIKLMLNSFFCAKLEHRSHRLTTCYIKKKEKNQSVKWWWCSFLHDQMLTFNLGPKGFFLRDSNL